MTGPSISRYDAVILAGGSARRFGRPDKPGTLVGDRSMLDRVVDAVAGAQRVIVVGLRQPTRRPVTWLREQPTGGGPVPALATGLTAVEAPVTVLLAADLPFLDAGLVTLLTDAVAAGHDGALVVDADGRDQLLVGAWRTSALRAALPPSPAGCRLSDILGRVSAVRVVAEATPGSPVPWFDCDTPADLAAARKWA